MIEIMVHHHQVVSHPHPMRQGRGGAMQHHLAPRSSTSSIQSGSESSSSYAHGYPEYLTPDLSTVVHDVQWCMSGRVWNSSPMWSPNGKQLLPEHGKCGTTTKQA
jgi:hypothetical protein